LNNSAKGTLPYLRIIFESNVEMAAGLTKWFEFDESMIEYLAGTKKQTKKIIKSLSQHL
jgi:hypothetical protein